MRKVRLELRWVVVAAIVRYTSAFGSRYMEVHEEQPRMPGHLLNDSRREKLTPRTMWWCPHSDTLIVAPLNVSEESVASELVLEASPHGIVAGADGKYDIGKLYDYMLAHSALLFRPPPKQNSGGGHRSPARSRMLLARLWVDGGAEL